MPSYRWARVRRRSTTACRTRTRREAPGARAAPEPEPSQGKRAAPCAIARAVPHSTRAASVGEQSTRRSASKRREGSVCPRVLPSASASPTWAGAAGSHLFEGYLEGKTNLRRLARRGNGAGRRPLGRQSRQGQLRRRIGRGTEQRRRRRHRRSADRARSGRNWQVRRERHRRRRKLSRRLLHVWS